MYVIGTGSKKDSDFFNSKSKNKNVQLTKKQGESAAFLQ